MIMQLSMGRLDKNCENLINSSIDSNGNIVGLQKDSRYNSSDVFTENADYNSCGFIPYMDGEIIHQEGMCFGNQSNGACYLRCYDKDFNIITGNITPYSIVQNSYSASIASANFVFYITYDTNNDLKTVKINQIKNFDKEIAYIRWAWRQYTATNGKEKIWKEEEK